MPRDVFNALTRFHKVDNGAVRLMTQAESDLFITEELQASASAETARLADMDTRITNVKIADFPMAKIDAMIDAIANLNDAKQFLKRMCRYVAKNSGNRN